MSKYCEARAFDGMCKQHHIPVEKCWDAPEESQSNQDRRTGARCKGCGKDLTMCECGDPMTHQLEELKGKVAETIGQNITIIPEPVSREPIIHGQKEAMLAIVQLIAQHDTELGKRAVRKFADEIYGDVAGAYLMSKNPGTAALLEKVEAILNEQYQHKSKETDMEEISQPSEGNSVGDGI